MTSEYSVRLRTLTLISTTLCICFIGIVIMDDGIDAIDDPDSSVTIDPGGSGPGSSEKPVFIPSEDLNSDISDFVHKYESYITTRSSVYFEFESGSEVMFSPSPVGSDSIIFEVVDKGPLEYDMVGILWGTATGDFVIDVSDSNFIDSRLYFIAVEPELGSEQNPYTGEATIPLVDGGEAWVEVGTYVQFDTGGRAYGFDGFQGSGLMNEGHALNGTVTTPGNYEIQYGSAGASDVPVYDYVFTLHVVGDVMLEFLSDPTSDGILIPPNHHLVRFIGSDGVLIGYDIVEHGGFMQLPEGHESDLWSESADLSSGVFDTSQPVESDLSLYVSTSPTAAQRYEVHIVEYEGGNTNVSPVVAQQGRTVTITATPDEGYYIYSVEVVDADDNRIQVNESGSNTYTFRMPRSDVYVHIVYDTSVHTSGSN